MASIFGFTIKHIVKFKGREGEGCQGDIFYNGAKVGWYNDSADGGMADIDFWQGDSKRRDEIQAIFDKAVKEYFARFPLGGAFKDIDPDGELFMAALVELTEFENEYKKYCRTGRKYFVSYEDEVGFLTCVASSSPTLFESVRKNKTAFNVKEYSSLLDFTIK